MGPNSWKYLSPMYPLAEDMSKNMGPNSWKYLSPMYPLVEDMSKVKNVCPSSAKSICYFSVCHWVVSQGSGCSGHSAYLSISQHTGRTREGALADYSMANRKIAYTLGRGRAYISDMSSTSGYMGEKYFQEFGPRFLDMSYCQKGSHLQRGVDFCCQTGLHRGGYNYEI